MSDTKMSEKDENDALTKITEKRRGSITLKREMGLYSAVNLMLGVMIGSGIFVSPGQVLEHAGSVALCLIIWIVSGIISLLGALAYAELATVVTRSGAEYAYFIEAFSQMHKFWGPLPAFICAWIYIVILRPAEVAIIVIACAENTIQPFTSNTEEPWKSHAVTLTSISVLLIITYINARSVKLFVKVQNVFGIFKVGACLAVIGGGIYEIAKGNTKNLNRGFEGSTKSVGKMTLSLVAGLWAYDGWNTASSVTEELINPAVNVPRSILISVPLMTALNTFMSTAYMAVLTYDEMTTVPAVAVVFGERVFGSWNFVIPITVALSCFGAAMSVQFGTTRMCYTAAHNGHMMELFSYLHIKRLTPAPAVALQAFLSIIMVTVGQLKSLVEFATWFLWFFYGLAMVALLVLRKTQPNKERPYRVPTVVPCFVLLVALVLSVLSIVEDPSLKYVIAIVFLIVGIGVYTWFVYYKKVPTAFIKKVTFIVQMLFESVPPDPRRDSNS